MTRNSVGTLYVVVRRMSFGDGIGGMERAAAQHIAAMRDLGLEVVVVTPTALGQGLADQRDILDVPWPRWNRSRRSPLFGPAYWAWTSRVGRTLASLLEAHDVIHMHGGAAGVLLTTPRLRKYPSVANVHGMEEFGEFAILKLLNRLFLRPLARASRFAGAVIATDVSLVAAVTRNIGAPPSRISIIPNVVDVVNLRQIASAPSTPDTGDRRYTVVTVGRIVHNKGYDLLAAALDPSRDDRGFPPVRWIHFGSGPEQESLLAIARARDVDIEIRPGRSDTEVQSELARADLFVQPSRYEGSSLTTLEAMAHGVTVVATPVGGIPDKIRDGENGFLAKEVSSDALLTAIRRARFADDVAAVRRAARLTVEREFAPEVAARSYLDLYQDLVAGQL